MKHFPHIKQIFLGWSIFSYFLLSFSANAQGIDTAFIVPQIEEREIVLDTVFSDKEFVTRSKSKVTYTLGLNGLKTFKPDTTLDFFHIYDPAQRADFRFLNTGNTGSAAHYIFYDNYTPFGFRTGYEQFDIYRLTKDNLPFYKSRVSYSNLKMVIGSKKEQLYAISHHQNIGSQFKFGFNFRRTASTGAYTNSETGNNSVVLNGNLSSKNKRYNAETILLLNNMKSLENSGVKFAGMFADTTFTTKTLLEVNTPQARTEDRTMGAIFKQSYAFGKKSFNQLNDTVSLYAFHPAISFYHQIEYSRQKYRYFDSSPDSLFYDDFYAISDSLENSFKLKNFRNELGMYFSKIKKLDSVDTPIFNNFLIQTSATYAYLEWFNDFAFQALSEFNVLLSISDHPNVSGRFLYGGKLQMALASYNQGDLRADAYLGMQGKKWGQLRFLTNYSRQEPAYIAQHFVIRDFTWKNNFQKENYFSLGVNYSFPKYQLSVKGRMHTLSNLIYYGADSRAMQSNKTQNLFSADLQHSLRLKWFGLDNLLRLQYLTQNNALRVPLFWMRSSIYAQGKIFKKVLLAKIGFDVFYNTPYEQLYYFPLTGQFQLNGNAEMSYVPRLDIFFSMQVKSLSLFVKMQNLVQGLGKQNGSFNFYRYPEYDRAFKMGLSWDFFN